MALHAVFSLLQQPGSWMWAVLASVVYIAAVCIYRRFFHPLAPVPGPFLPAVTKFYQSYYNRRYYLQIERMHQRYGPIVRVTPDEVHLAEMEHYDTVYSLGNKYGKTPNYYKAFSVPHSTFGTISNEVHRIRRAALNPMFSRQKVLELETVVQDKARKVCRLVQAAVPGEPVDLYHAFRAVSLDVISDFAFDHCYDFLDQDDIGAAFFEVSRGFGPALYAFFQFPALQTLAHSIPPWMAPYLSKSLGTIIAMQMDGVRQIERVKEKMRAGEKLGRQTIFTTLLSPKDKPDRYVIPTTAELKDEAYALISAASESTGNAMTVGTFHVLNNPAIYKRISLELSTKFPHSTSELPLLELEKLPYLVSLPHRISIQLPDPFANFFSQSAVIKESLRLSFGVAGRLPRIVLPPAAATFHGYVVPPGYSVSMSSWMMHRNPAVFPDPMRFDPERWLQGEEVSRRLDRSMVPFTRGKRQCAGMQLASSELYVMLGMLFRRFPSGLKVWNTPEDLMNDWDDYFNIYHPDPRRDQWFKAYVEDNEKS